MVVATFMFASHDAMSKYLSGFYPIILIVWARYLVHTLLMAGIFLPRSGLRVLRTKRPLLQALRALCLLVFGHLPDSTALVGILIICLSGLAAAWQSRR